jgi:hypothetical protein
MRTQSNIFQRVAAFSQQVVFFVGYVHGAQTIDPKVSIRQCAFDFVNRYDLECDEHTLECQYNRYMEVQRLYQKEKKS